MMAKSRVGFGPKKNTGSHPCVFWNGKCFFHPIRSPIHCEPDQLFQHRLPPVSLSVDAMYHYRRFRLGEPAAPAARQRHCPDSVHYFFWILCRALLYNNVAHPKKSHLLRFRGVWFGFLEPGSCGILLRRPSPACDSNNDALR